MRSPTSSAATAGAGEEVPLKKRNREDDHEDGASRLEHLLFNDHTDSEQETRSSSSDGTGNASDEDPEDFTEEGLRATDAVLSVSKSVVSLSASIDGDPQSTFVCTGMVAAHEGSAAWVITSATLIRKPAGSDTEVHLASDVKINVALHSKEIVDGLLLMYDLQYNIAVVSIEGRVDLPAVMLSDLPDSYFLEPRLVVAIVREFGTQRLRVKRGEIFRESSKLDCNELVVSTCQIKQSFIGGPLMDLERRIVGMSFIDEETTPFLPVEVVGRCLRHFKKFGEIKHPWLGIRGRSLHLLELAKLEEICHQYPKPLSGMLVEMIPEASSANCGGIEVGDIINELEGVVLHSVSQFTAMLLHTLEAAVCTQKPAILEAVIQRPRDASTFIAKLKVMERPPGEFDTLSKNRWELPLPEDELYFWDTPVTFEESD